MKNNKKLILALVLGPVALLSLSACTSDNVDDLKSSAGVGQNQKNDLVVNEQVKQKKLSVISERCTGCGKCARIDAEHFVISNEKAKVISNGNLNSDNLLTAIAVCHSQAIDLS